VHIQLHGVGAQLRRGADAASEFSTSRADAPRCATTSARGWGELTEQAVRFLRLDPVRLLLDVVHRLVVLGLGEDRFQVRRVLRGIVDRLAVHGVAVMRVYADPAVELRVRHPQPAVSIGMNMFSRSTSLVISWRYRSRLSSLSFALSGSVWCSAPS